MKHLSAHTTDSSRFAVPYTTAAYVSYIEHKSASGWIGSMFADSGV